MTSSRRRQLLRLATSDQVCEEVPLSRPASGGQDAWQRLKELEQRIHQQQPPILNVEVDESNNNNSKSPLCSACHQLDRQYLLWHLPPNCVQFSKQVGATTTEWAAAVTRAGQPDSPVLRSLFDELRNDGGSLAFDQSEPASRLLTDAASFLSELISRQLSVELPAVFGDASVSLVGGWAQETALAGEFPVLDFLVNLPAWARTCRLCLCQLAPGPINGVAVRRSSQAGAAPQPIETSTTRRACASAIEAAVLQRALDLLEQPTSSANAGRRCRLSASRELGWWRQAGRDWPPEAAQPKCLRLNLVWQSDDVAASDSGARIFGVNIWFGVPVVLLPPAGGPTEPSERPRLRGHLLLGASEPRLLRLAMEERRWLLGNSRHSNDPAPLLCRAAKFVLKLGEYLAEDVSMTGQHRRRPGLSFGINSSVRELTLRYADSGIQREAFAEGANLQERLLDLLSSLERQQQTAPAVFTQALRIGLGTSSSTSSSTSAATSAAQLSESALSIIRYLERAVQSPLSCTENLLPTMLEYFKLKNQPESLLKGDQDDRLLGLATQISFDMLTLAD